MQKGGRQRKWEGYGRSCMREEGSASGRFDRSCMREEGSASGRGMVGHA